MLGSLPVSVPPGEGRALVVRTLFRGKPGLLTRTVGLVLDDQGMRRTTFRITARVTEVEATAVTPSGQE